MHGKSAIIAVSLAIGLLFASNLGYAPDTLEDGDLLLAVIDSTPPGPGLEVLPVRGPVLVVHRRLERVASTGREFSAPIFHPPIA